MTYPLNKPFKRHSETTPKPMIQALLALITSFNNEPISTFLSPSLTSISQPIQQMGTETVHLLLKQIESGDALVSYELVVMETQLVIRESSLRTGLY